MTSSSSEPVSDAPASSRRAARSSSAISALPRERSGNEQQDRGRRTLALDRFDQPGQLVAAERLEDQPLGRPGRVGHRGEGVVEGVLAGQLVGLVGGHDAQPARVARRGPGRRPGPACRRRRRGGPRGSGRPAGARPRRVSRPEDRLEHAGLAPLRIDRRLAARQQAQGGQPRRAVPGTSRMSSSAPVSTRAGRSASGTRSRSRVEGHADRRIGIARAARTGPGSGSPRTARAGRPAGWRVSVSRRETPTPPEPAISRVVERPSAVASRAARDPGELALSPDEARARERRRHARILGARSPPGYLSGAHLDRSSAVGAQPRPRIAVRRGTGPVGSWVVRSGGWSGWRARSSPKWGWRRRADWPTIRAWRSSAPKAVAARLPARWRLPG